MGKLNLKMSGRGPVSNKALAAIKKHINKKIIDISELRDAKIQSENIANTIISEKKLSQLDPLHGIYTYAQNMMSVFIEQIADLPALSKLADAYANAEDIYIPSGPPMSPLTRSYFTCWGFFDLCTGIKKETLGTVIIDVCRALGMDQGLITVFEHMQQSRMGVYVHEGFSDGYVQLREIITHERINVIVPSGYKGKSGEIWLTRIMPEPFPELNFGYAVAFISPYILCEMENNNFIIPYEENWISFFERNLDKTGIKDKKRAYESLMKYGLNRHYWNEYIFEGYVNYSPEMILLAGFPDTPLSMPQSKESCDKREH